jgi:3-hydroxyacyl-[acyl-carrier-protein] dehydratase
LTSFIEAQLRGTAGAPASADSSSAGGGNPLDRLPHLDPFRFVSRVTSMKAGESAEAVWALTGREPFFGGHFPGNPIVPGVLIAEALAQAAGLALPTTGVPMNGVLAHVDVRFEQAVAPPTEIVLRAKLSRSMGTLSQFEVEASSGDKVVARGTLALSCTPADV